MNEVSTHPTAIHPPPSYPQKKHLGSCHTNRIQVLNNDGRYFHL